MEKRVGLLAGLGMGVGFMYLMDPDRGRRRRAVARDKLVRQFNRAGGGVDVAVRDLAHRTQGLAARARGRLFRREPDDNVLVARVRSTLGRLASHPHAIDVLAREGNVTLRGLILAEELLPLVTAIRSVAGVASVENQLKQHQREEHVPALQGGAMRVGNRSELIRENWAPSARFLVGVGGAGATFAGLRRRDALGMALAGVGTGLMVRAVSNQGLKRFFGIGPGAMIHVHKSIHIRSSSEQIFRFLSDFENFELFLPETIEVRTLGQNRAHWIIRGPGGAKIHWNAVTTRFEPNELIAWRSESGALVPNSGRIRFFPEKDGTRVEFELGYRPPIGRLGHAIARIAGADPKSRLDDALVRVKGHFERGPERELPTPAVGYERES